MSTAPATVSVHTPDALVLSSPRDPLAQPLLDALAAEYRTRYADMIKPDNDTAAEEVYHRYGADLFEPPHGCFLLLLRDGVPIAGGGLIPHADAGTAELKRIWTSADHRRQGLAKRIVLALEDHAARLGYSRVYLTTAFRQPEASALYERLGYTALWNPDDDPATRFWLPFEKTLRA